MSSSFQNRLALYYIFGRRDFNVFVASSGDGNRLSQRRDCTAVIGQVSNIDHENVNLGKAGRKRHMGVRPGSRGSVMNPCDHPHGGGEGRAPVGHSSPRTPWGKPALGLKTRKHKARSDKFIVKRANG